MRAAVDTTPELRLGRWQDVAADLTADAVISDPPFSARTHEGGGRAEREDGYAVDGLAPEYAAWTRDDVHDFVRHWSPRCRGWMVAITDHLLAPHWEAAYHDVGRYAFPPVGIVIRGMSVRLRGDGPSSWTLYALVARPATREFAAWGTLDGGYTGPRSGRGWSSGGRGKPDWLLQALVRDYSRPGDLVVDPCCGWGSTLAAARALDRRSIGIDVDPDAIGEARRRLAAPIQGEIFLDGGHDAEAR